METWNGNRLDGCIFALPSPKDHRAEFVADGSIPRQIDLRASCTPIEDQGQIGSCTANACVGALEYLYFKRDGQAPDLSRLFVYYNTRRLKGTLHLDSGAAVSEAMAAVLAFGACRAQLWPYSPAQFGAEPSPQAYADGRLHEAIQYARVSGVDGAIQALAQGYPVVFGTFVPQRCYDEAASTGIIPTTTEVERQARPSGGHCMLIVGYDLDKKIFHVRNSWGAGWGNAGYCEFPFEEMTWSCPGDSFWMLVELEPKGNFSISKPDFQDSQSLQAKPSDADMSTAVAATKALRDQIRGALQSDVDKMKADLRKSILDAPDGDVPAGVEQEPEQDHTEQDHSSMPLSARRVDCAMCNNSRKCHCCSGTGRIWDQQCRQCSGSGKCYACLYF